MYAGPSAMIIFFFNDTATTEIYTRSLHDALPILPLGGLFGLPTLLEMLSLRLRGGEVAPAPVEHGRGEDVVEDLVDRKSTRLNSSHANISYAVFCLKKKKKHVNHYVYSRIIITTC